MNTEAQKARVCSVLMYICFGAGVIWWYFDKQMRENALVKFHLRQMITILFFFLLVKFSTFPFLAFPPIEWMGTVAAGVLLIIPWLFGLVNSIQGLETPVPIVGQFSENIKI